MTKPTHRDTPPARIGAAIDLLFAALLDEGRWPDALASLGQLFDAPHVCMVRASPDMRELQGVRSRASRADSAHRYSEHHFDLDPLRAAFQGLAPGQWFAGAALHGSAPPHGDPWIVGGKLHADSHSTTLLKLQRPPEQDRFDATHRRLFGLLAPQLQWVAALDAELHHLQAQKAMVTAALDGFGWPAFVLAQSGAVLLHNTQAQRLMAARQVCRLSAGKLLLTRADAQQALNEALHRACAERGARMAVLPVGPADGVRAWNLRVVPMPRGIAAQPCALAYAGPARPPAPPVKLLQQAYGLSESQAEVAFMLAELSKSRM